MFVTLLLFLYVELYILVSIKIRFPYKIIRMSWRVSSDSLTTSTVVENKVTSIFCGVLTPIIIQKGRKVELCKWTDVEISISYPDISNTQWKKLQLYISSVSSKMTVGMWNSLIAQSFKIKCYLKKMYIFVLPIQFRCAKPGGGHKDNIKYILSFVCLIH
jgi:hypothetical protein